MAKETKDQIAQMVRRTTRQKGRRTRIPSRSRRRRGRRRGGRRRGRRRRGRRGGGRRGRGRRRGINHSSCTLPHHPTKLDGRNSEIFSEFYTIFLSDTYISLQSKQI